MGEGVLQAVLFVQGGMQMRLAEACSSRTHPVLHAALALQCRRRISMHVGMQLRKNTPAAAAPSCMPGLTW